LRRISARGSLAAGGAFLALGIERDNLFKDVIELALEFVDGHKSPE
jgi:hypothetical protein